MSRYDYRTRRELFNRHGSNPHKNFGAFEKEFIHRRRVQRTSRFLIVLLLLVALIGVVVFAANAKNTQKPPAPFKKEVEITATTKRL